MTRPVGERVRDYLADLAGHDPIETHLSEVFVGTDTVWKRKKAVRLPFIDLTGLAERHRCLAREFELNQAPAPGLYRDVVAVVHLPDGRLECRTDPAGAEIVEWVLRMARVPVADLLDQRAAAGRLDRGMLAALADMVAGLHDALPAVAAWDQPGVLGRVVAGNVDAARAAGLNPAAVEQWWAGCATWLERLRPWLQARAALGFVRRAHGDLHLGNICVWHGRLVPFDALEFDEALATIDTGYDLAFLLMDLDRRVSRGAANQVMNRYVARTGDADLTAGLPLFLSLRSMVRAHVRTLAGHVPEGAGYLQAALDYLADGEAVVVAIGGLPGSGKSTMARRLAPGLGRAPGALVIRSDEVRKRRYDVPPEQHLPADAYLEAANQATNAAMLDSVILAAKGGQAVIADATFLDPGQRAAIEAACAAEGLTFRGMWLEAPMETLLRRVRARTGDASDATELVLLRAAERGLEEMCWTPVENT